MVKPIVVFPFHDPAGVMFEHLKSITPLLKQIFSSAYLSIPPATHINHPLSIAWLRNDPFYRLHFLSSEMPIGRHFCSLYEFAATSCDQAHVLHLCYVDRLIFALASHHRQQFMHDIQAVTPAQAPLIFQRSLKAWHTHPRNYYAAEKIVSLVGQFLLDASLDFAWCHLVIQSSLLRQIIPHVVNEDISMVAELILLSQSHIKTQEVDWLEWEDPFFSSKNAVTLKQEREESALETKKRLAYVIPMVQKIIEHARNAG